MAEEGGVVDLAAVWKAVDNLKYGRIYVTDDDVETLVDGVAALVQEVEALRRRVEELEEGSRFNDRGGGVAGNRSNAREIPVKCPEERDSPFSVIRAATSVGTNKCQVT